MDGYGSPYVFYTYTNGNGDFAVINWPAGDYVDVYVYVPTGMTVTTRFGD